MQFAEYNMNYTNNGSIPAYDPTVMHRNYKGNFTAASPITQTTSPIVTGTTVIAAKYNGGILMITDTLGSYGSLAMFKSISRMHAMNSQILIGASGEYSDFQYIVKNLEQLSKEEFFEATEISKVTIGANSNNNNNNNNNDVAMSDEKSDESTQSSASTDSPFTLPSKTISSTHYNKKAWRVDEISSYLNRVLYNRRSKIDPLWCTILAAGVGANGHPYLAMLDLYGSHTTHNFAATGYGQHLALPILRARLGDEETTPRISLTSTDRPTATYKSREEVKQVLIDCMKICYVRDARAFNKFQMGDIRMGTETEGPSVHISEPFSLDIEWEYSRFVTPKDHSFASTN
jgi:20S proteasome subunit beta 7